MRNLSHGDATGELNQTRVKTKAEMMQIAKTIIIASLAAER